MKLLLKNWRDFLNSTKQRPSRKPVREFGSNAERAALLASKNAATNVVDEKLNEGTVTKFPTDRVRPSQVEDEDQDPVGTTYTIQPYGTDLPGDTRLEADEEDMTSKEIKMLRQIIGKRKQTSQQTRASDVQDIEDEIEDLADAFMMGNLADLFADED